MGGRHRGRDWRFFLVEALGFVLVGALSFVLVEALDFVLVEALNFFLVEALGFVLVRRVVGVLFLVTTVGVVTFDSVKEHYQHVNQLVAKRTF